MATDNKKIKFMCECGSENIKTSHFRVFHKEGENCDLTEKSLTAYRCAECNNRMLDLSLMLTIEEPITVIEE